MTRRDVNKGIYVTGHGQVKAEQMAVGAHAHVEKVVFQADADLERRGLVEVRDKLHQLLRATQDEASALEDSAGTMSAIECVAEELKRDKPSRVTLNGLLDGIAQSAGQVTKVMNAAAALKAAVLTIFV